MNNTFKLRNGRILLSTEAPGGIYNSSQLKKIAALCDGDSVTVKATEDQRLALIVNPEKAPSVAAELKSMGLGVRHYQDGLHQPVSCIGEMCELHEQDALGSALDISAELEGIKLKSPLKIGINGCAKCCVPCHTLDVSVIGDTQGYCISLGGKTSQLPEIASFVAEGIPPSEIARLVKSIVDIYRSTAEDGESLQEVIDRDGPGKFIEALAPWSQDASTANDPFTESNSVDVIQASDQIDSISLEGIPALANSDDQPSIGADEINQTPSENSRDDEALHALGAENIEPSLVDDSLEYSVEGTDIHLNAEAATSEPTEISVHARESNVDMDVILDHSDDGQMKVVHIDETLHNTQPTNPEITSTEDMRSEVAENPESSNISLYETESISVSSDDMMKDDSILHESPKLAEDSFTAVDSAAHSEPEEDTKTTISEEEKIEAELIASIAAQQELTDSDNLETERDLSAELLEQSEVSLPALDVAPVQDSQTIMDDQVDADGSSVEEFQSYETSESISKIPQINASRRPTQLSIQAFDLDDVGNAVITWSNGIILTLTHDAVKAGQIKFCGHDIKIMESTAGIHVEVDGMRMLLPNAA